MTFDPSNDLSAEARALLDAASDGDAPTGADRARVRAGIARRLAIGVAAGAVAATTVKSAVAGSAAASSGVAGASTGGVAVSGAAAATSIAGGTVAAGASAAATGTAVAVGSTALTGGALTFGIAGAGGKILAAIAIVGAIGAGTMTYQQVRSSDRAQAAPSALVGQATDRNDVVAKPPSRAAVTATPARPARSELPAPIAAAPASPLPVAPVVPVVPVVPDRGRVAFAPGASSPSAASANAPSVAAAAPAADSAGDLVAELALLRDAHAALRDGDGARALALLADHARRFPSGALTEEREASRVLALCKVGRALEARDAASRFLREHPRSPQASRVAHACDDDSSF